LKRGGEGGKRGRNKEGKERERWKSASIFGDKVRGRSRNFKRHLMLVTLHTQIGDIPT